MTTFDSDGIAINLKSSAHQVATNLQPAEGTSLPGRIEVEATHPIGSEDEKVCTVSENARTLKFEQSVFDES